MMLMYPNRLEQILGVLYVLSFKGYRLTNNNPLLSKLPNCSEIGNSFEPTFVLMYM